MKLGGLSLMQLLRDLLREIDEDNVTTGAAALAYYLMLSIFPALISMLSLLPYLPIPHLDRAIMDLLRQAMPQEAAGLLATTVQSVVSEKRGNLLSLGLIGTLWAASSGMAAIMHQLNVTYDVKEGRSFLKARALALLLTLLFGVLVIGGFALVVLGGVLQHWFVVAIGSSRLLLAAFAVLRWVIIIAALMLGFALVYYLAPNIEQRFRWVSAGSVVGTVLLVLASLGFRIYVDNFGHYEATYGSLGTVVILLLWLYVTGLVLLVGSEINALLEPSRRREIRPGDREPS